MERADTDASCRSSFGDFDLEGVFSFVAPSKRLFACTIRVRTGAARGVALRVRLGCRLIRIGTWRERRDLQYVNELIRMNHFEEVRDEDVLAEGAYAK